MSANAAVKKRNLQIEGLRGIAILMVVLFHVFPRYWQLFLESDIAWMSQWGTFGVTVFLLISCYFMVSPITGKCCAPGFNKEFGFFSYLLKKLIRLWPCYAMSVSITFVIMQIQPLAGRESDLLDWLINLTFLNGFIGVPYVDAAHWYLTTLIAITVVIGIIKKLRLEDSWYIYILWMLAAGGLSIMDMNSVARVIGGSYAGIACIGIALRKLLFIIEQCGERKALVPWAIITVCGVAFTFVVSGLSAGICLIIGILLFWLTAGNYLKPMENGLCVWLGEISYPFYLIHQNIAYAIIFALSNAAGITSGWFCMISFTVVLLLGAVMTYFVEKPVQRFIKSKIG